MKKVIALVALMGLLGAITNCQVNRDGPNSLSVTAEPTLPRAMKGYELYSWQLGGEWYFSLLEGTNRVKTLQEVTADAVAVKGVESIERKLGRLSKGEQVFWTLRDIPDVALPPEGTVNQIEDFCTTRGIDIVVAN